ncbi:hypothetical protein EVAR_59130_1 [Eumeta japonica]|uniref:(+)RNA virus helicase C-terminal domain-containing protein n=1 Tax=Eumeta variegata TaxID=151549 RepID=A0A4C1ZJD6_EUMVA|nr:hypothetical protein EVAR_59130_1 [Eumeta japonica]
MTTYSATDDLGVLDEEQMDSIERRKYITLSYAPIMVIARCMRVALEKRFLEMTKTVIRRKNSSDAREDWVVPDIIWVIGVPGCRKTSWVVKHFKLGRDIIITITRKPARDLKEAS